MQVGGHQLQLPAQGFNGAEGLLRKINHPWGGADRSPVLGRFKSFQIVRPGDGEPKKRHKYGRGQQAAQESAF